jgi:hypothetical protein
MCHFEGGTTEKSLIKSTVVKDVSLPFDMMWIICLLTINK